MLAFDPQKGRRLVRSRDGSEKAICGAVDVIAAVVGGERVIEPVHERGLVPLYIIISGED